MLYFGVILYHLQTQDIQSAKPLVATLRMLAKRTELFLSAQKNTRSRTKKAPSKNNLRNGDLFKHIQDIHNLPDIFMLPNSPPSDSMSKELFRQAVRCNTKVLDSDDNWNLLLHITTIIIGLKSSRELCLFS